LRSIRRLISTQLQIRRGAGGAQLRAERHVVAHLLDAKRTYFDTLADYYEAIAEVASSRAALESAVGVPLEIESSKSNP